jgi:hypothetical protein
MSIYLAPAGETVEYFDNDMDRLRVVVVSVRSRDRVVGR